MYLPETGRALAARFRGASWNGPSRQPTSTVLKAAAKSAPAPAASQTGRLHTREAGPVPEVDENGPEVPHGAGPVDLSAGATSDHAFVLLRRGETADAPEWDMLAVMGPPSPPSQTTSDVAASPSGVSAFVARVLDQLTLSAWLPAALLSASLAILLEFRSTRSVNVLHAIAALTANPLRVLVAMIPLLVITTVVTQAFSFEAIRTLEGYWRRRWIASAARTIMIKIQVHRKSAITKRLHDAYWKALDAAEPQIGASGVVFSALRSDLADEESPSLTEEQEAELSEIDWRASCDPWHLANIDQLLIDEEAYPDSPRILPTKLGNVIRATEDKLENTNGDLQGFVLRHYGTAPRRVQMQHDQFRNRLDMYCTLVFVSASLALLGPAILAGSGIGIGAVAIISCSFGVLSGASYLAAIASAGGYCAALKEIDKSVSSAGQS